MAKLMTNFVNNPSFTKLFPPGSDTLLAIFFPFSAQCLFMKFRDYRGSRGRANSLGGEEDRPFGLHLANCAAFCHNGAQQTFTNDAAPRPDIFYRTWPPPSRSLIFSPEDLQRFRCLTFSSVKCYPRGLYNVTTLGQQRASCVNSNGDKVDTHNRSAMFLRF